MNPAVWEGLYTEAHWHIRQLHDSSPRWAELIITEVNGQLWRLKQLADQVGVFVDHLAAAEGVFALVDTNVLLHFEPPESVRWPEVVGSPQVRLTLPLRVIEELDEKKYTARENLADRARRLLSQLRNHVESGSGKPVVLRDGVTIEVPVDNGPRLRTVDADQEILDLARDYQEAGAAVALITDDTGMFLRGQVMGLRMIEMPEGYLRKPPSHVGTR